MNKYVFGYGTLRNNVPLCSIPSFLKSVGTATIDAQLWKITNRYNYGRYQYWAGVTLNKKQKTIGEVFKVSHDKGWNNLDQREAIDEEMYERKTVNATLKNGKEIEVEVYCVGKNSKKREKVKSGDWKNVLLNKE